MSGNYSTGHRYKSCNWPAKTLSFEEVITENVVGTQDCSCSSTSAAGPSLEHSGSLRNLQAPVVAGALFSRGSRQFSVEGPRWSAFKNVRKALKQDLSFIFSCPVFGFIVRVVGKPPKSCSQNKCEFHSKKERVLSHRCVVLWSGLLSVSGCEEGDWVGKERGVAERKVSEEERDKGRREERQQALSWLHMEPVSEEGEEMEERRLVH
ncbi:uncharacterized protein LOC117076219 [Trachypithecus francoisi]|uniref:uncharacterized protein LOC117076219 n=1 Tax=Trachypithecus francoisi TaxID=54180 RepID=UPI00141BF2BB|nr:uncharacterized protein LOC117076219 [Trachypithecus francoisi]